jgi:hypothetical protein
MAVHFSTPDPRHLLEALKGRITDGKIKTWEVDDEGDFTHTAYRWAKRAWFVPSIRDNCLTFNIMNPTNTNISTALYAIYHCRLIESALLHCDALFWDATASALPERDDSVGPE